jgi:hypothetical protein
MSVAQARQPGFGDHQAPGHLKVMRSELDDLERLSADEVTALLQRRFRRFLEHGCNHRQALMLAVGID